MEAGPKVLENGALHMEKLPRTPAKAMGSGLEEHQCSGMCSPPDHTPGKTEAAKCPCSLIIFVGGRWSKDVDVLFERRSTALVNLALFL